MQAVECKRDAARFDPENLQVFRCLYPDGKNMVVCSNVLEPSAREMAGIEISFTGLDRGGLTSSRSPKTER